MSAPRILLIGTADTKADELRFIASQIESQGGAVDVMDVGVLGRTDLPCAVSSAEVAAAAGATLAQIAALGDENEAMKRMAAGAVAIARERHAAGEVQGVLCLGGTMGTDLALDVTAALPLGLPKFIVSTVAYSHLIPPERLAPDLMMILWAGGLYGLNDLCRSILAQAAGAIIGACRASSAHACPAVSDHGSTPTPSERRPLVAITSLGKSCLSYMVGLKPALEHRGYDVAVFHCTGMGGRAFESLAANGRFAAVLDLCMQEVANEALGSVVTSGAGRLEAAGIAGIPQIVAPGSADLIDLQSWKPLPAAYEARPYHAHNRLIGSVAMTAEERRQVARTIGSKLSRATGPVAFILPERGIEEWDRPGAPLHDPDGLAAFCNAIREHVVAPVRLVELEAHINDAAFCDAVMAVFDDWVSRGWIVRGGRA